MIASTLLHSIGEAADWLCANLPRDVGKSSWVRVHELNCQLGVLRTDVGCDTHELLDKRGRGAVVVSMQLYEQKPFSRISNQRELDDDWGEKGFHKAVDQLHAWGHKKRNIQGEISQMLPKLDRFQGHEDHRLFVGALAKLVHSCARTPRTTKVDPTLMLSERIARGILLNKITANKLAEINELIDRFDEPGFRMLLMLNQLRG